MIVVCCMILFYYRSYQSLLLEKYRIKTAPAVVTAANSRLICGYGEKAQRKQVLKISKEKNVVKD